MEKKIFTYGKLKYHYELKTLKRKSIALTVWPDMHLTVVCPEYVTEVQILSFLKKKWRWLDVQLKFFARFNRKQYRKEYISGEEILYLGKQYQLLVQRSDSDEVKLMRGKLVVSTVRDVSNGVYTRKLLDDWYQNKIEKIFIDRYQEMRKKFDIKTYPKLHVRPMTKRWGSFTSSNKIVLNPVLIQATKECIDYVITHELCHTQHRNHSKNFYRLLDKKYPGWKMIKEKLEARFA